MYGSKWSSTPWNDITGTGRDGSHVRLGKYADTGPTAAMRFAIVHASRSVIAPPYERPVAYTRDLSTHSRRSRSLSNAVTNTTSVLPFRFQPAPNEPTELPACGYTTMKFSLSLMGTNPSVDRWLAALAPRPWNDSTTGIAVVPFQCTGMCTNA